MKRLDLPLKEYLRRHFMLWDDYLGRLRCFEQYSTFLDMPVKQFRIFSPELAKEHGVTIKNSSDLEEHPELLLFVGRVDCRGQVCIADLRSPVWRITNN